MERAWCRLSQYVIDVKKSTSYDLVNWRTPMEVSTGQTIDRTGLLYFKFWDKIIYYGPSKEDEKIGKWLGRATNYEDTICYWILTLETEQLIVRGTVRNLTDPEWKALTQNNKQEIIQKESSLPIIENEQITEKDSLLYFNSKLILPQSLVNKILQTLHNSVLAGHPGNRKTFEIFN